MCMEALRNGRANEQISEHNNIDLSPRHRYRSAVCSGIHDHKIAEAKNNDPAC